MNRYSITGDEGQYEPGSDGRVLANKLAIKDPAQLAEVELELLLRLYDEVLPTVPRDQALTVSTIREWHRNWLGSLYSWAGRTRTVDLVKDDFPFASAAQIPRLLQDFEREYLGKLTPCQGMSDSQLAHAIAVVHVELILIHPFREGNGRLARFVADAMAAQPGVGPLDYTSWQEDKQLYIKAIHAGMGGDYGLMEDLVSRALIDGTDAAF